MSTYRLHPACFVISSKYAFLVLPLPLCPLILPSNMFVINGLCRSKWPHIFQLLSLMILYRIFLPLTWFNTSMLLFSLSNWLLIIFSTFTFPWLPASSCLVPCTFLLIPLVVLLLVYDLFYK